VEIELSSTFTCETYPRRGWFTARLVYASRRDHAQSWYQLPGLVATLRMIIGRLRSAARGRRGGWTHMERWQLPNARAASHAMAAASERRSPSRGHTAPH
jgi:hypothetical protein